MQAEIWRAASHSRFHVRYFRLFPGFLGLKSFLNFFKKRVLGPIFTPQSSFEGARRVALPPPCMLCTPNFFEGFFFLHHFPATREPSSQMARQSDSQATRQPARPSSRLEKITRSLPRSRPAPPKVQTFRDGEFQRQQILETTKKPRGEPRGFSGAVDET